MNKHVTVILAKSAVSGSSTGGLDNWDCPLCAKNHTPNAVTIAALKEGLDIRSGKKKTKTYHSAEELLADLNA